MASRLNGLALSTIGVPRAEAVDEAFAARLFALAARNSAGLRGSVLIISFEEHEFAAPVGNNVVNLVKS